MMNENDNFDWCDSHADSIHDIVHIHLQDNRPLKRLKAIRQVSVQMERMLEKIEMLRVATEHGSTIPYGVEMAHGGSAKDLGTKICERNDIMVEYKVLSDYYIKMITEAEGRLRKLGEKHGMKYANVLSLYYIDGKKLLDVCCSMQYSYPQIMRIKKAAEILYCEKDDTQ